MISNFTDWMRPRSAKRLLLGLSAIVNIVAVSLALLILVQGRGATVAAPFPPSVIPIDEAIRPVSASTGTTSEGAFSRGETEAPVTLVEYIDYQCPACAGVFHQLEPRLNEEYIETGLVRLVTRDLPLRIHPNAVPAAVAANCAGNQGAYWEMHDALLARQPEWQGDANLSLRVYSYADELDLDIDEFRKCFSDQDRHTAVLQSSEQARLDGIASTPTFLINGERVETAELIAAIDRALVGVETDESQ